MKTRVITSDKDITINDFWIKDDLIDATPINNAYSHPSITPHSNLNFYLSIYKNIGIDIVTESVFSYKNPIISEKTIRPLLFKKIFIVVGAPHTLSFLKKKGFKTLTPYINEHYDTIYDPTERFTFITTEILRIASLPINDISKMYNELDDILTHNFHLLKKLEHIELDNFISKLKNHG